MNDIRFYCPSCRQRVVCDAEYGGQSSTCPTCQIEITIPVASYLTLNVVRDFAASVPPPLPRPHPDSSLATSSDQPEPSPEDLEKSFRNTMNILGAMGIGVGSMVFVVSLFLLAGKMPLPEGYSKDSIPVLGLIALISGVAHLASGIGACFKKTWGILALLVLGYFGLINAGLNILGGNTMGWLWVWVGVGIVQRGHTALGLRRKLKLSSSRTLPQPARFAPAVAVIMLGCAASISGASGAEPPVAKSIFPTVDVRGGFCSNEHQANSDSPRKFVVTGSRKYSEAENMKRQANASLQRQQNDLNRSQQLLNSMNRNQSQMQTAERTRQTDATFAKANQQMQQTSARLDQVQSIQNSQLRQQSLMQSVDRASRINEQVTRQQNFLNNSRAPTTPHIPPTAVTQPRTYSPPASYTYIPPPTFTQPRVFNSPPVNTYTPPRTYAPPPTPYIPPPPPRIR